MLKLIKRLVSQKIHNFLTKYTSPNMKFGYLNNDGTYQKKTRISNTVFLYHKEKIHISNDVFIWHYTILDGTGGIYIGEGSQIGAWVGIFTHSSHIAIRIYGKHYQDVPENEKKGYPINPVKIGKFSFIGARSIILPNVTIGNGVIVTAGSIVKKNIEDFMIVSGNPAEIIGDTRKLPCRL